jgi:hypothetical protein
MFVVTLLFRPRYFRRRLSRAIFLIALASPLHLWGDSSSAPVFGASEVRPIQVSEPILVEAQRARSTEWHHYKTVTLDQLVEFEPQSIHLSEYGGRLDRRAEATGFFRTERLEDRWVIIDPLGYHFWAMGVNLVGPERYQKDREFAFAQTFGTETEWARQTREQLVDSYHFNSLGNWSGGWSIMQAIGEPMPYTVQLGIIQSFAKKKGLYLPSYGATNLVGDVIPAFHPDLPAYIDQVAADLLTPLAADPWLFGIFSDNEVPLFEAGIIGRYLDFGPDDPGAQAARSWLEARGLSESAVTAEHDHAFAVFAISHYYRMVHAAIRKYSPKHMFLGSRFHRSIWYQASAYEAIGPYADIISVNMYHNWTLPQQTISEMASLAGRPIMITEWYAKGEDSGLRNVSGAGWLVRTQSDRGCFYENYTLSLLRNPHLVGWHWFRYADEGPMHFREKSSNKGLVDAWFRPYEELVRSAARINVNAYALRDYLLNAESPNLFDITTTGEIEMPAVAGYDDGDGL